MGNIHIQPESTTSIPEKGVITKTLVKKGLTVDIEADILANPKGTTITGYGKVKSIEMHRSEGDISTVTYTCFDTVEGQIPEEDTPLTTTVALSSTRVEIPIKAFCGISPGQDPQLFYINGWEKEQDEALYNAYKFKDKKGIIWDLSINAPTTTMAQLIRAGQTSVIMFFPVVIQTKSYNYKPNPSDKLGRIDTPPSWATSAEAWLKMQEDISQQSDGTWIKNESWQGADNWPAVFYSTNASTRWQIGGYHG